MFWTIHFVRLWSCLLKPLNFNFTTTTMLVHGRVQKHFGKLCVLCIRLYFNVLTSLYEWGKYLLSSGIFFPFKSWKFPSRIVWFPFPGFGILDFSWKVVNLLALVVSLLVGILFLLTVNTEILDIGQYWYILFISYQILRYLIYDVPLGPILLILSIWYNQYCQFWYHK